MAMRVGTGECEILGGTPEETRSESSGTAGGQSENLQRRTHTRSRTRARALANVHGPLGMLPGACDGAPSPSPQSSGEVGMTHLRTSCERVLWGFLGFIPTLVVSKDRGSSDCGNW